MTFRNIFFTLLILTLISCQQTSDKNTNTASKDPKPATAETSIYQQAGIIRIHDPKATMVGYRAPGDDIFDISLDDVGKYTGHVCAGITSGYMLTKKALEVLYPNDEMPVRGDISIVASSYSDPVEVASYITRARQSEGDEKEKNTLSFDPAIKASKAGVTLILKRNDTGKMVKAVFDKSKLNPEMMKHLKPLKMKITTGTATDEEKAAFAKDVQKVVKQIITETPEGLLTVSEITD